MGKGTKEKAPEQPFVVYELVGTGKTVVRLFDPSLPFDAFRSQVAASLGVGQTSGQSASLILKNVREGGKEVELDDQYDFEGLKARAKATAQQGDGASLLIRVHSSVAPISQPVASTSRSPVVLAPISAKSQGKRKAYDSPSNPPTPTTNASPASASSESSKLSKRAKKAAEKSAKKSKTPKTVSTTEPTRPSAPSTPSPASQSIAVNGSPKDLVSDARAATPHPSKNATAGAVSKKRARETSPPDPSLLGGVSDSPRPSETASPASKKRKVLPLPHLANLYKPLRPSPLGQQFDSNDEGEASVKPSRNSQKRRRRKERQSLARGETSPPASPALASPSAVSAVTSPPASTPIETPANAKVVKPTPKKATKKPAASPFAAAMSPASSASVDVLPEAADPPLAQVASPISASVATSAEKTKKRKAAVTAETATSATNAPLSAPASGPKEVQVAATPVKATELPVAKAKRGAKAKSADDNGQVKVKPLSSASTIMQEWREKLRREKEEKEQRDAANAGGTAATAEDVTAPSTSTAGQAIETPATQLEVVAAQPTPTPATPKAKDTSGTAEKARGKSTAASTPVTTQVVAETSHTDSLMTNGEMPITLSAVVTDASSSSSREKAEGSPDVRTVAAAASSPAASLSSVKRGRKSLTGSAPGVLKAKAEDRAACSFCGGKPKHLQKECPVVLAGLQSVQSVLADKRELLHSRPDDVDLQDLVGSLEAWQDRLVRRERLRPIISEAQNSSEADVSAAISPVQETPIDDDAAEKAIEPALNPTAASSLDQAQPASPSAMASPLRPISQPPSPPAAIPAPIGLPYPARSVLLSKQGTPSKSSRSGISQSDVVFQTADEVSSSSESEDESDTAEGGSSNSSLDNTDDESSSSSGSEDSEEVSDDEQSSPEGADATALPSDDPEEVLRHFFSTPLSRQQKKAARLSNVSHDVARLPSKSPEDMSASEDEVVKPARLREASFSSVDGPEDEDDQEDGISGENAANVSLSIPVASAEPDEHGDEGSAEVIATPTGSTSSPGIVTPVNGADGSSAARSPSPGTEHEPVSGNSPLKRQSFTEMALPSPVVMVEGDEAMAEAMAQDDEPEAWAAIQTQPDKYSAVKDARLSKGLPSPPFSASSSQNQDIDMDINLSSSREVDGGTGPESPVKEASRGLTSPQKAPVTTNNQSNSSSGSVADDEDVTLANSAVLSVRRRSARSASRDAAAAPSASSRALRSVSREAVSSTLPARGTRRLRSASREVPASLPASPVQTRRTSGRTLRVSASQESSTTQPAAQTSLKIVKPRKLGPVKEDKSQSSQPLRRSSRRASTQEPVEVSSQVDELATSEPPSAPPNGEPRFPSPVPEDEGEQQDDNDVPLAATQFTQIQSPPAPVNPLFFSLGSYPQQTQHYTAHPDISSSIREDAPSSSPVPNGQRERPSSPMEDEQVLNDDDDDEAYGSAAEQMISPSASKSDVFRSPLSTASASGVAGAEEETTGPAAGPGTSAEPEDMSDEDIHAAIASTKTIGAPRLPISYSQPVPQKATGIFSSHIPTLSSLSSELLRMGRSAIGGSPKMTVSASQPNTPSLLTAAEDDSSDDSDSSAEGAVPSALAARVAGAAKKPRRSMRDSMGW